jgi:hypothetical protein
MSILSRSWMASSFSRVTYDVAIGVTFHISRSAASLHLNNRIQLSSVYCFVRSVPYRKLTGVELLPMIRRGQKRNNFVLQLFVYNKVYDPVDKK